jgi:ribulose-phosphate 3-epimerase
MLNEVRISPSLICTDLCNIEQNIRKIEALGIDMLHIDIIDGYFSPSMPIGLDMVQQLKERTNLKFDVHLMARDNDFFLNEILKIGVYQVCFQYESTIHIDRTVGMIKDAGCRAGISLTPSTPITNLEYIIDRLDYVMLMLVNPGYANHANEKIVPYAYRKVRDLYDFINYRKTGSEIEIDGRLSLDNIADLVACGADILVVGSTGFFVKDCSLKENLNKIREASFTGLKMREIS